MTLDVRRVHRLLPVFLILLTVGGWWGPSAPAASAAVPTTGGTRFVDPLYPAAGVAATVSYDPTQALNQHQTLTIDATGGTFRLGVAGSFTAPIAFDADAAAVEAALADLPAGLLPAPISVTGGSGGLFGGRHYRLTFAGSAGGTFPLLSVDATALVSAFGAHGWLQCDRCADVYLPQDGGPPAGGRPVVLLLHAGGFSKGAKDGAMSDLAYGRMPVWASALTQLGYVAVAVNYTIGDPADLVRQISCAWDTPNEPGVPCPEVLVAARRAAQHDVQAAVRWLRMSARSTAAGGLGNPYGLAPGKVAAIGESAGAMAALDALYRPDDPGTVGGLQESSTVQAAVAASGFAASSDQRPGAGPALLLTFTNDVMAGLYGLDMFDEAAKVVRRGRAVGNVVEQRGYCEPFDYGGTRYPQHLALPGRPEFMDWLVSTRDFLWEHLTAPTLDGAPSPYRLDGASPRSIPLRRSAAQTLYGDHRGVNGDFNGDGVADILWYGPGATCDTIWFGHGDGTYDDAVESVVDGSLVPAIDLGGTYDAAVHDFTGDGADDVLWVDRSRAAPLVATIGRPNEPPVTVAGDTFIPGVQVRVGDFDANGVTDLAMVIDAVTTLAPTLEGYDEQGAVLVAFDPGTPTESGWGGLIPGNATATVGDLDGDGRDDLLLDAPAGGTVLYGNALGGDSPFDRRDLTTPLPARPLVVADIDGDGRDDVLAAPGASQVVWRGTATRGAFTVATLGTPPAGAQRAVADLDGDGAADIAWLGPTGSEIWYSGRVVVSDPAAVPAGWGVTVIPGGTSGSRGPASLQMTLGAPYG